MEQFLKLMSGLCSLPTVKKDEDDMSYSMYKAT